MYNWIWCILAVQRLTVLAIRMSVLVYMTVKDGGSYCIRTSSSSSTLASESSLSSLLLSLSRPLHLSDETVEPGVLLES